MTEPTLDVLAQRLDRLERENRRLKITGALALLGLISVALMGQAVLSDAPLVEAQTFYVRDKAGRVRAMLGADGLSLMDATGAVRVAVSATGDAPGLSLRDKAGAVVWKAP
jgi:hypothetical protein